MSEAVQLESRAKDAAQMCVVEIKKECNATREK